MTSYCTTPKRISDGVRQLCEKVLPGSAPQFVQIIPADGALPSECFPNVEQHVLKFGGRSVIGWQLWEWPGVFAEAEFHAVWESPNGTLVDITPKADGEGAILFIADPTRRYEGRLVANIKHPIAKGEIVRDYIKLLDIGFSFFEGSVGLPKSALAHFGRTLQESLDATQSMLVKERSAKGKCTCGSGLIYSDCHRDNVKSAIEELSKIADKFEK